MELVDSDIGPGLSHMAISKVFWTPIIVRFKGKRKVTNWEKLSTKLTLIPAVNHIRLQKQP